MAVEGIPGLLRWAPFMSFKAGERFAAPNGDIVTANIDFTAGATYSATNVTASNQDGRIHALEVLGGITPGNTSDAAVAGLLGSGTDTRNALDVRYVNEADAASLVTGMVTGAGTVQTALDSRYVNESDAVSMVTGAGGFQTALDTRYAPTSGGKPVGKGELVINVVDKGAVGDGTTDDTAAFQAVADLGGIAYVPKRTYVVNTVSLTKDLVVICQPGTVFKRKAGVNTSTTGHWNPGAAMFEVNSPGLKVSFSDFTFDGNNVNQTATEPIGYFLKTYPTTSITSSPTTVIINRGNFINGTSGYLLLRGDDVQKRYETFAYLHECTFSDTVPGKGKGDPSTPTAIGYSPSYVLMMDYVRLRTTNFRAEFNGATPTGVYAPCAINGTYFGSTYANSGESSLFMHGTTYLKNMGRSIKSYDDANWNTNNAIGAIDMYGNPDTLFVENVVAVNSQFVTVRSKGSIKNYTVMNATLTNCQRGLQVSASSTGACEAVVRIGHVSAIGGGMPQVEMVGTSTSDRLRHVSIGSVHLLGPFNNVEGLTVQGAVHARNITRISLGDATILSAILIGVTFVDVKDVAVRALEIDGTSNSGVGLYVSGGDNITVEQININNTAASGVNFVNNPKKIVLRDGRITNTTDYGVFSNTSTSELLVQGIEVDTVAGLNRAFYAGGGNVAFENNKSNAGTHLMVVSGTRKRERNNSWNAAQSPGTAAPTVGTFSVGDVVWNSAPAASGTMGWVCVTAGTPGTWKTFGSIAA